MKTTKLQKGTMVGIANTVGAFPIIRECRVPDYYLVLYHGFSTLRIHRSQLSELTSSSRYLYCGQRENFVRIERGAIL